MGLSAQVSPLLTLPANGCAHGGSQRPAAAQGTSQKLPFYEA